MHLAWLLTQLAPALDSFLDSRRCRRRAVTAAVCKAWAAVHVNAGSLIWEAVSLLDCKRAHLASQHDEGTGSGLNSWLTARAPVLQQLAFCDECVYLRAMSGEKVTSLCSTVSSTSKRRPMRATTSCNFLALLISTNLIRPAPPTVAMNIAAGHSADLSWAHFLFLL